MIYLDNHSTTRTDPEVIQAMVKMMETSYANPGSTTHEFGRHSAELVQGAIDSMGRAIGATGDELIVTSGGTESNNLAIFGTCLHPRQPRRRVLSLASEHRAILDPLKRLTRHGFEVVEIPIQQASGEIPGQVDLEELERRIDDSVAMVSIMRANNETGVLQPMRAIAHLCRKNGCLFHTDATQSMGHETIDVDAWDVDLLSFSAHKFYGPKGIGGLYVRSRERRTRLDAQMLGGGHQQNRRSGTLPSPLILGMSVAMELCGRHGEEEQKRIRVLRDTLWSGLREKIPNLVLNGPSLVDPKHRLGRNLNCEFPGVEGESLMMAARDLAVSSGSACTSADPRPSHVLMSLGLSEDQARSSLRFGVGRFNTREEIDTAIQWLAEAYHGLRAKY